MPRRPPPPTARVAVAPSEWERFVDRRGVLAACSLMVAIVALSATRLRPSPLGHALAFPQLLLLLIVLGCIAVLSYRSDDA